MSRIFAFVGSPFKETSNTYRVTRMMLDRLAELDAGIESELLTAGQIDLRFCQGCELCMSQGFCPEEEHDDVGMIKRKMIQADLVVLGSPMYGGGMTGQLKTLLDRLCVFCPEKRLAGTPCVTVATSGMTPCDKIHDAIADAAREMSMHPVARLEAYGERGRLLEPEEAQKAARAVAEQILGYATGAKAPDITPELEEKFEQMKALVPYLPETCATVVQYWKQNGLLEAKDYADFVQKTKAI